MANVYYVSTTGSNANNGLTVGAAFATVTYACSIWNALAAGSQGGVVINVLPGTYNETQVYCQPASGSSGNGVLTIQPYTAGTRPKLICNPSSGAGVFLWSAANTGDTTSGYCGVTFTGFEITDGTPGGNMLGGIEVDTPSCTISNCYLHDIGLNLAANTQGGCIGNFGYGTGTTNFGLTITQNTIIHCGPTAGGNQWHGIYPGSYGDIITSNLVGNIPGGYGIHGYHLCTHCSIVNNTCFACTSDGIIVGSGTIVSQNNYIANNICYGNGGYSTSGWGIRTIAATDYNTLVDNCCFNNVNTALNLGGVHDTSSGLIQSDPLFVNYSATGTGNYSLRAESPCIGTGAAGSNAPLLDILGYAWPNKLGYDIGAYSFPTVPAPNALTSTFMVGTYNSVNDAWKPLLDLNDFINFWIELNAMKMPQPEKVYSRSFNIRTPGENIFKVQYKNRHIQVSVRLKNTSTQAILNSVRALIAAIEAPPYVLRIALPGATQYSYADVIAVKHNIPSDPQAILAKVIPSIQIDFECKPGLRGDRIWLQNLAFNPGFEAPSGPAVVAFTDAFTNANAYQDQQYAPVIATDTPSRYYRLADPIGTATALDSTTNNQTATVNGTVTFRETGPMTGDFSALFDGSTGYLSVPVTGFATGNTNWSVECWVYFTANPTSNARPVYIGTGATANEYMFLQVSTTGTASFNVGGTSSPGSSALSLSTWHHLVGVYDGADARLYVDGTQVGTGTAYSALSMQSTMVGTIGSYNNGGGFFFPGQITEVAIYGSALSAARITAHHSAGVAGLVSVASNVMTIPNGGQIAFGSPAWGPFNLWSIRFQWLTGLTATFYLHYTDANDYTSVVVNGSTLVINQTISGTVHTIATVAAVLTTATYYWLQTTQPPYLPGAQIGLQTTLYNDSAGSLGTQLATTSGATIDGLTGLVGRPQIAPSGAALLVGGNFTNVHTYSLFGPGGWLFTGLNATTGQCALAWDGLYALDGMSGNGVANTFPSGPVAGIGSARIDLPPAGTINCSIFNYSGTVATAQQAMPTATGHTLAASCWVRSAGLTGNASIQLRLYEYSSGGSSLRNTTIGSVLGNQANWTQFSGTVTMGASTAFAGLYVYVIDPVANDVPSGTIWLDNMQCWDQTTTGETTMPYCELRFVQSPGQMLTSGLVGDIPAPAIVEVGGYFSSLHTGHSATLMVGRRANASNNIRLVGASTGSGTNILDSTSYGGYKTLANLGPFVYSSQNETGIYHIIGRAQTANTTPTNVNMAVQAYLVQITGGNYSGADPTLTSWQGPNVSPFTVVNQWTVVDTGQIILPPAPLGALVDPTQVAGFASTTSGGTGGSQLTVNWVALLPVDGELFVGLATNLASQSINLTGWMYLYWDGTVGATTYSTETVSLPNAAHSAGDIAGTAGSIAAQNVLLTVVPNADTMPQVDPTVDTQNAAGVNQYLVHMVDDLATVIPVAVDIIYSPLYLFPR